jgi:hypothetical protein
MAKEPNMGSRPDGVSVVAVASAVLGLLAVLAAFLWWGASDYALSISRVHVERLVGLVLILVAVLQFVTAWGVWSLRSWAWPVGVALDGVVIVLAVLQLGHGFPLSHLLTIALAGVALWFLFSQPVRAALESKPGA